MLNIYRTNFPVQSELPPPCQYFVEISKRTLSTVVRLTICVHLFKLFFNCFLIRRLFFMCLGKRVQEAICLGITVVLMFFNGCHLLIYFEPENWHYIFGAARKFSDSLTYIIWTLITFINPSMDLAYIN